MAERGDGVRIGDHDRDRVIALLGEHFSAGRLEIDEFDERCRLAARARFRSDVAALFADLPYPHPEVLTTRQSAPAVEPEGPASGGAPSRRRGAALGVAVVVAMIGLLVVTRQIWVLLPLVGFAFVWFGTRR
ncbi:DUF1707 domain-containing protein [Actinopolyspora erythraea]|uniref:DUF1707 domain-containing protein n=1 Tax=Actinopolyspora erythraea TaxID=414996 RepID=A0A099D306_9ACTN|nr:DUF1707 domain-containing protein [Actinopolyspora erythraea]ASU77576.1 DUF1707 domain-containing protein [Actinopolyspora erythraea]KGI80429.1 hypothetical protein IL38_17175 [Actinopolyspora erythraea]